MVQSTMYHATESIPPVPSCSLPMHVSMQIWTASVIDHDVEKV